MKQWIDGLRTRNKKMLAKCRYLLVLPFLCAEGATALEFAIVTPILLLLLLGIVEYSLVLYGSAVLEGATITAAREGKTGYVQACTPPTPPDQCMTRGQYILSILQSRITGLLDPSKVVLTPQSYSSFATVNPEPCYSNPNPPPCPGAPGVGFDDINGNGIWDANPGTPGEGNAGDIVLYTATYKWNIITPFISQYLGTNGVYTLSSSMLVKNEPYGSGTTR